MAKAKRKEIISYDPNSKVLYKLADSLLSEAEGKISANYCVSYIPANQVQYAAISVTDDSIEASEAVGNKAYEELGLDIETDYQIRYSLSESRSTDGVDIYNVLSVETQILETTFKDVISKVNYFDYIDYEPMLYSAYYSNATFSGQGVDIYIYLHKTYATLTVYKDAELCAFRCLTKLSIDSLHAAFCHELAERIPEHVFCDELNRYGLDHIDDTKRVALNKVFADSCMLLINNINFVLRQLKSDNEAVATVVVGADIGSNSNLLDKFKCVFATFKSADADMLLEAMLENNYEQNNESLIVGSFVNIHKVGYDLLKNFKSFASENDRNTISPFVMMSLMRANEQLRETNDIFNVSIFLRPPPLFKRDSGKLIATVLLAALISSIYPAVNYINGYFINEEAQGILDQLPVKRQEESALKSRISQLQSSISQTRSQVDAENTRLNIRNGLVNELYDKKVNYLSKAKLITNLTKELNHAHVSIDKLDVSQDVVRMTLVGSSTAITDFISKLGSNTNYDIRSREVNIATQGDVYASELEIRIAQ